MVSESIFSDDDLIIPMADVQHIEKLKLNGEPNGLWAITCHTKYNFDRDIWENPIYIPERIAGNFLLAWRTFRGEKDEVNNKCHDGTRIPEGG